MTKDEAETLAAGLHVGETQHGLSCPACLGGRTRERKLSVTRTELGVLYCCHRDSCGSSGFVVTIAEGVTEPIGLSGERVGVRIRGERNQYRGHLTSVISPWKELILSKWGLSSRHVALGRLRLAWDHDPANRRTAPDALGGDEVPKLYVPVGGVDGSSLGAVLRSLGGSGHIKADPRYIDPQANGMAIYIVPNCTKLVIVEDIISALRLYAAGISSCALLGTNINLDKLSILASIRGPERLYIALDADALATSIEGKIKFQSVFSNLKIVELDKDIKNKDELELKSFLDKYIV